MAELGTIAARARARLRHEAQGLAARVRVRLASRHLSGPRRIRLAPDEVALVCMLRDGAYYLDVLLAHHRARGVKAFLFIDNGSSDGTPERLATEPDVTVVANHLPVARYESRLRAQIARRVVRGGWFLFVDSDELAEMPGGEGRPVSDYARYCNEGGYDVVVGQTLDLFSDRPLSETAGWSYAESTRRLDRYSLRAIETFGYHAPGLELTWFLRGNAVSNPDIGLKFGGIRREVFGEDCALTVHRMVRNDPRIGIYTHPHCSSDARVADFTMLIRHYKFAGPYLARERAQVAARTWEHGEGETRLRAIRDEAFAIRGEEERRYEGTGPLVAEGFLAASARAQARLVDPPEARRVA